MESSSDQPVAATPEQSKASSDKPVAATPEQSKASSTDIQPFLTQISALVGSPDFKAAQDAFFQKHCLEFAAGADPGTDEKPSHTAIHNSYVRDVEGRIGAHIGQPALEAVMQGLPDFLNAHAGAGKDQGIADAVDLLESMGDFGAFKQTMLWKRAELETPGCGGARDANLGGATVVDLEGSLENCAKLVQAASAAEGWKEVTSTPELTAWSKPGPGKDTILRIALDLDMPMKHASALVAYFGPESLEWRYNLTSLEICRDYSPHDKVVRCGLRVPWLLRYIMSIPDEVTMRIVVRHDFPEEGSLSYVVVPFDLEKNLAINEWGPMKIKSGVVQPHPHDPQNKSILHSLDMAELGMVPSWGVPMLVRTLVRKQFGKMSEQFKASTYFREHFKESVSRKPSLTEQ